MCFLLNVLVPTPNAEKIRHANDLSYIKGCMMELISLTGCV